MKPGEAGTYRMENGVLTRVSYLKHNPWSWACSKRIQGEPYDPDQKCPLCNKPYVIEELGM